MSAFLSQHAALKYSNGFDRPTITPEDGARRGDGHQAGRSAGEGTTCVVDRKSEYTFWQRPLLYERRCKPFRAGHRNTSIFASAL